jgi:hypothetical protein
MEAEEHKLIQHTGLIQCRHEANLGAHIQQIGILATIMNIYGFYREIE